MIMGFQQIKKQASMIKKIELTHFI